MRALKLLGLVVAGLIALVAAAAVAVLLLVDPNDFKDRIAQAAKRATGRELAIRGTIELKLFPQLALGVNDASLGNPEGFGDAPFATVRRLALRVAVMPLLRKELEVGRIEIDGLDLRLAKNAEGKGNWEDFGQKPAAGADGQTDGLRSLELDGLRVTDGRVHYDTLAIEKIDLDVGHFAPRTAVPVKLAFDLQSGPETSGLHATGSFVLTPDLPAKQYALATLALAGTVTPKGAAQPVPWRFSAPRFDIDLAAQTLAKTDFEAQLGLAKLAGSIEGQQLIDAPALAGQLRIAAFALRELMTQFGLTPPVTRDAQALSSLALAGRYAWSAGRVQVESLDLRLDESRVQGKLGMDIASGAKVFDLTVDRMDADRYLPPPTTADKGKKAPFELPVSTLKTLRAKGTLAVGALKLAGVNLAGVQLGVEAHDGVTQLAPIRARLYDGQYTGTVRVDAKGSTPSLAIDQTLSGIDISALLSDFAKTKRLSGRGTLAMNVTGQGSGGDALMKSLRGTTSASLTGGAVEGIDLWYGIAQAQSLIQQRTLSATPNTKRTAFETFKASADIADGVATTKDLAVMSQQLRVAGKGSTNLVTQALDYSLDVTVLKGPAADDATLSALTLATIPVKVTGSFEDPKVRPDFAGMAKARLQKEVDKRKDELKEKAREKVQDALKGLFGR